MARKFDVLCLGILVADVVLSGAETLPPRGCIQSVAALSLNSGGCAINTAIALARLGFKVGVIGKVGRDALGDFLCNTLAHAGVNTDGVTISQQPTGAAVACIYPDGERGFLSLLGANGDMRSQDVDPDLLSATRVLHVAGSPFLRGFSGQPCAGLMKYARSQGVVTSLDTIHYELPDLMELLTPELRQTDLLLPSCQEARTMTQLSEPAAMAQKLMNYGVTATVIKLGDQGAYMQDRLISQAIPPVPVKRVVDAVGAGDAFVAGVLAGYLKGRPLTQCVQWGNIVGSQCVSAVGASAGITNLPDVEKKWIEVYG